MTEELNCTELMLIKDPFFKSLTYCIKKVKEDSEKVGIKLNSQKTKIMASGPIASWQTNGESVETVSGFIFLCTKFTADGD